MDIETDVKIFSEPSSEETQGVTSEVSTPDTQTDVPSEPSSETDTGPQSLAEAVLAVVKPTEEPDPTLETGDKAQTTEENQPPSEDKSGDKTGESQEALPDEISQEELDGYSERVQKRIQSLLAQNREAKEVVDRVQPQLDFVQQHGIPPDAVRFGLNIAAALNYGDHETFLKAISPLVQKAQQAMGITLPPDLQQQVDQGYTTRELAQQLSVQRAQSDQLRVQQEQMREQQENDRALQMAHSVKSAITGWEAEVRKSDPDYARKEPIIQNYAKALIRDHGFPSDPAGAVELAKRALDMANEHIRQLVPAHQPRATRPMASSMGSSSASVSADPTSLRDAVLQGLRKVR